MKNFEEIFDLALSELRTGKTPEQIVASLTEVDAKQKTELISLLNVAQNGLNIAKLIPPSPVKQYRYEEKATVANWFMEKVWFAKMAMVPIALVIALAGGRTVINATESSLPGDTLYSLKRATEEARITLTRDPEKVASLHVELMQKRVNEVRQAANSGNEDAETKAIEELKTQTSKTFEEATPVATANALSKQDSSLLDTLVAVSKQQKDVLEDLSAKDENHDAKMVAATALEDSKKNDQTLAKIIATVNEQALIDLPNKISITGAITYHQYNRITVEKNTFTIDEKTTITDSNNEVLDSNTVLTGRVSVVGQKINGVLIAKQIALLPEEDGEVKGDVTPTTSITKPISKPATKPSNSNVNTAPTEPAQPETPTRASGSYIAEPANQENSF